MKREAKYYRRSSLFIDPGAGTKSAMPEDDVHGSDDATGHRLRNAGQRQAAGNS